MSGQLSRASPRNRTNKSTSQQTMAHKITLMIPKQTNTYNQFATNNMIQTLTYIPYMSLGKKTCNPKSKPHKPHIVEDQLVDAKHISLTKMLLQNATMSLLYESKYPIVTKCF